MENKAAAVTGARMDPMETVLTIGDGGVRSYMVRSGRLTGLQIDAIKTLYPRHGVDWNPEGELSSMALTGRDLPLVVEVGFGMGVATAEIARSLPDLCFLGLEVHAPGLGKLLSLIEEYGLTNVRVCRHDAVEVVGMMIPPESVTGFHVFFPDPWPKKKHHKRRIMNARFVSLLSSRLKKGGYIYFVTDWEEYADETLALLSQESSLLNAHEPWASRKPWRPITKFEQRAIDEGRTIRELEFIKK